MGKPFFMLTLIVIFISTTVYAKVDLVTLPTRDKVQLTIYNSEDLTLVRDLRSLTMREGLNKLQFSWSNTLIDPTSLDMKILKDSDKINILDITFPPGVKDLGLWHVESKVSGSVPMEIEYFTSGISWRAYYIGTLSEKEDLMNLKGYVRVINKSGEDYENTEIRLIVGEIHLLDKIKELSESQLPDDIRAELEELAGQVNIYTAKQRVAAIRNNTDENENFRRLAEETKRKAEEMMKKYSKKIIKEGLSEYFIFNIPGKETIQNKWAKRLISFSQNDIPIENLYKYEEERYETNVKRFLYFKNDEEHKMGKEPLPGGLVKIFKNIGQKNNMSYIGSDDTKYIPVKQKVELDLGNAKEVDIDVKKVDYKTENYIFNKYHVIGWDDVSQYKIKIKNMRKIEVSIEIKRNVQGKWDLEKNIGLEGKYEKEDEDTFKYNLKLKPNEEKEFSYIIREYKGKRAENR